MKIYLNDREIEIFKGANLGDILWKFSKEEYYRVLDGMKKIVDNKGNQVLLDGELDEGDMFYLKEG